MEYIIINENRGRVAPGDVSIFRSARDAEHKIEAIDVKNNEYVGIFIDGYFATLSLSQEGVTIKKNLSRQEVALARLYLEYAWRRSRNLVGRPFPEDLCQAAQEIGFVR